MERAKPEVEEKNLYRGPGYMAIASGLIGGPVPLFQGSGLWQITGVVG